ncbi:hypothetical protein PVAR5_6766 [Paecilomyces variotii No. 5]|uniref:Major facilitator superfamily (MFS) profile domain-containing protein n=1 Tax=Byssochlamys spectabilis (strain No. 5 / NBRC 109023) TaxID=1356009 RepID=V5G151_BYSSN|nr:hypothetical protein PVAR5_6766 [Paecilomyces variotii No. 5]
MFWQSKYLSYAQILLITAPSFILYGYNQAGLSALLTLPDVVSLFPEIDTIHTSGADKAHKSTIQGLVNGCLQLGALTGALSCSVFGDRFGRRRTIFLGGLLSGIGHILQCTAFYLPQFIIGRFILGLGVGQVNVIVPVWQAECSSASRRGRQVITAGIFICVGFALTSWINFGFTFVSSLPLQWRIPLAIPTACSIIICFSIFSLPESPRWLVQKSRVIEATETLAWLNGIDSNNEFILNEISRIESALATSAATRISLREIFRGKDEGRYALRFGLCLLIQTLQQLVGGGVVSNYTTIIFENNLHLTGRIPSIVAAGSLTWKFICSFMAYAAVDRFGRRMIFLISGTGMSLCMIVMAISTSFPASNHQASIVAAVFIFVFNFCYPIGFLGGNFLYCTEVAPPQLRAVMSSVSTANHWMWNFVFTMITPVALSTIGWKYYIVFACTCACIPLVVIPFFPETVNRDLERIDLVFREAATIWDIVPMARKLPQQSHRLFDDDPASEKAMEVEVRSSTHREFAP